MCVASTLSGVLAIRHPKYNILCRADGKVFRHIKAAGLCDKCEWTSGSYDKDGYYRIRHKDKVLKVHRLIAEAFLLNPENKPTVDHINRIRDDNRVENLRWATVAEQNKNRSI